MSIPSTSPGVVAHAAHDLRVEPVAVRVPGPDEAIVEVATAASADPTCTTGAGRGR